MTNFLREFQPGEGTFRFAGKPAVFFLAHCVDCWPDRFAPMPFGSADESARDTWAAEHATTGHNINFYVELRT